jgi:hypothetical protein
MATEPASGRPRDERQSRTARPTRWPRRVALLGAVVLLPKCLWCIAGYAIAMTGWLAGPELCGLEAPEAPGVAVIAGLGLGALLSWRWWGRGSGNKVSESSRDVR